MSRTPYNNRVLTVMLKCIDCTTNAYEPLDDKQMYKIALPSFIKNGGDEYEMFSKAVDHTTGKVLCYLLLGWINNHVIPLNILD